MTPEQHERLKASIKKWGFIVPIITNKDLLIADGEQRWTVAKDLGMPNVLVIRLPVEEVDRRLLRQVLNKLRGEHELLLDAEEFEAIIDLGHKDDLKYLLDLSDNKLERYLTELHPPKDEEFEVPPIDQVKTEITTGDIIELGKHKLLCGDATKQADADKLMGLQLADMVFTDPPYNVNLKYGEYDDDKTVEEYLRTIENACNNYNRIMQPNASIYMMSGDKFFVEIWRVFRQVFRFSLTLLWIKDAATLGNSDYQYNYEALLYGWKKTGKHKFYGTHYELAAELFNRDTGKEKTIHPAQRPPKLVSKYIINSSKPGELVVDFFGGSGSTLIACEQTGRVCYTVELDNRYCEIIAQRWEKYTGQKRKLLSKAD